MAEYICNLEFNITGLNTTNRIIKKMMEKYISYDFRVLRSKVIDSLNPNYESWNSEYDKLYGEEEDYSKCKEYLEFIANKQDEVLKTFDNEDSQVIIRSNREDCDLVGYGKKGTIFEGARIEMQMTNLTLVD